MAPEKIHPAIQKLTVSKVNLILDKEKIKELVLPVLEILVGTVLLLFLIIPKAKELLRINTQLSAQKKEYLALFAKLSDLETLSEADLTESADLLLAALPAKQDFYQFLLTTRRIFFESGVSLDSFDFTPGGTAADQEVLLRLSFSSTYDNFKRLLAVLEKALPIINIEYLKFKSFQVSADRSIDSLEGEISLKSYAQPLPAEIGKPDAPLVKITSAQLSLIEELKGYNRYSVAVEETSSEPVAVGKEYPF